MENIFYSFLEQKKLDLSNQVKDIFLLFPNLDSFTVDIKSSRIIKSGHLSNRNMAFYISKVGIKNLQHIDYWYEDHIMSSGFFINFLHLFYKNKFLILDIDKNIYNWDSFSNKLNISFYLSQECLNQYQYAINEPYSFTRDNLMQDIEVFYGRLLCTKVRYDYLKLHLETKSNSFTPALKI